MLFEIPIRLLIKQLTATRGCKTSKTKTRTKIKRKEKKKK